MSIQSQINQIENQEIVLPAIQRSFVWEEDKILRLLDSIMRKFPIGIILLWETYNDFQFRYFEKEFRRGNLYDFHENTNKKKLRLVLDGQQRLQSLFLAVYGLYNGKALYFDLLSGRDADNVAEEKYVFAFMKTDEANKKNYWNKAELLKDPGKRDKKFEVSYFHKAKELFQLGALDKTQLKKKLIRELSLSDEDQSRLDTNINRFTEAFSQDENILKVSIIDENLASSSSERKSESDILEIFVRINREGTPLSRSDLIFSMIKLNWKESAEEMPAFVKQINEGNSFSIDIDFIIRCLFAVSNLGTKFDIDILRSKKNVNLLRDNYLKCRDAIRATIDFVQNDCWCSNARVIGGQFTLIPFVYYLFHTKKHGIPNNQLASVRKAFFVFAFAKPFSRYAESRLGAFLRQELKPLADKQDNAFPAGKAIWWTKYWERVSSLEELLDDNDLLTLYLLQGLKGGKIQYDKNEPEVDHIFPRSELRNKGYDESMINHFANFWLLAKEKNRNKSNQHPKEYFKNVDITILNDALIDRDMLDYRSFTTFVEKRKIQIIKRIKDKIGFSDEELKDSDQ